ncbi:MAG: copper chaperone PCu(A)C [Rhodospirillaceae bacterium]|nr:copper chaperone PCu(A)C [Rhodospirillaceae bacterium]
MTKKTLALACLLAGLAAGPTLAHEFHVEGLTIDHPFARENPRVGGAGGAFMTITNSGDTDDILVGASSPVSADVELHTHIMEDGVMRMREVEGGIPVPAGTVVELQPGGYHVMFMEINEPLVEGDEFPLTLIFERAGSIDVMVSVEDISAGAHGGMEHMGETSEMDGAGHMEGMAESHGDTMPADTMADDTADDMADDTAADTAADSATEPMHGHTTE